LHSNRLAQTLLPALSTLLSNASTSLKEIDLIAVGVGPGSYTGTRVGVTIARSLAYGLRISLQGFCSSIAFLPDQMGAFASLFPAKSGLFYLLAGNKTECNVAIHRAEFLTPDELAIALLSADFVTAPNNAPIPPCNRPFFPFQPNPESALLYLQTSTSSDTELIYLN
jgi:tRNA threonylcarbamoyl adenosine modification protein YeaZ